MNRELRAKLECFEQLKMHAVKNKVDKLKKKQAILMLYNTGFKMGLKIFWKTKMCMLNGISINKPNGIQIGVRKICNCVNLSDKSFGLIKIKKKAILYRPRRYLFKLDSIPKEQFTTFDEPQILSEDNNNTSSIRKNLVFKTAFMKLKHLEKNRKRICFILFNSVSRIPRRLKSQTHIPKFLSNAFTTAVK